MLGYWTIPLKRGGSRPHITKAPEEVAIGIWTGDWGILKWHVGPVLIKVGNAVFSGNCRAETWVNFPGLQFLPVDRLEPFVALYFIAPLGPTA